MLYVNRSTAFERKLARINASSGAVRFGADAKEKLSKVPDELDGVPGRKSVRLYSAERFHGGLFVLSLTHMPEGCGAPPDPQVSPRQLSRPREGRPLPLRALVAPLAAFLFDLTRLLRQVVAAESLQLASLDPNWPWRYCRRFW